MRYNVFFKFQGMDGKSVVMPSKYNPFNFENLALALSALSLKLPDYSGVGVTPIGVVIESITDPMLDQK
jgi:hypothetical protein